jgi:hypothetical protein
MMTTAGAILCGPGGCSSRTKEIPEHQVTEALELLEDVLQDLDTPIVLGNHFRHLELNREARHTFPGRSFYGTERFQVFVKAYWTRERVDGKLVGGFLLRYVVFKDNGTPAGRGSVRPMTWIRTE